VTAVDLLAEFHRLGISLGVRNGMIVARPKGATPPKLREAVRAMKAELLRTLPEARDDGSRSTSRELHLRCSLA
jgi:TubC N-terminal docking domain